MSRPPLPPWRRLVADLAWPVLLVLLLASCAPRVITSPPMKRRVTVPTIPSNRAGTVPATQRPYRINGKTYYPIPSARGYVETGIASWYGRKFHGRKTSNGETYNMHQFTAAHKTLPMNTYLLVKNLENGREITVRVNDRGPFVRGRIIDLSYGAARQLGMARKGTALVRLTALGETRLVRQNGREVRRFTKLQDFEHGDFYVQIGSFANRANADRLENQLLRWGRKTVIRTYQHQGRLLYRVQVRGGTSLTAARRMERVLTEAGFPDAFVVAR